MCISYIPKAKRRQKPQNKKKEHNKTGEASQTVSKPKITITQLTIAECFGFDISESDPSKGAIEAT